MVPAPGGPSPPSKPDLPPEQARQWAERLGLPVRLWINDKQEAFVSGIAQVFPGVPHRYCENYFLRDLAPPALEADRKAKVAMRRKGRG